MSWAANLDLAFERDGPVTRLKRRGGHGPLYVQKPFYPEGNVCHVYLLHPPGGVAGGDSLEFSANVESGAEVLFTTPAATKYLRSAGVVASQLQSITVASGAFAEWLPQESIVFNCAEARNETVVRLRNGGIYLGCEVVALGRPAIGELFSKGTYTSVVRIERFCESSMRYRPVYLDRQQYAGGGAELTSHWGLANHPVVGTLVATSADADLLERVRHAAVAENCAVQATLVGDVLVARGVGSATADVQARLRKCWSVIRPLLLRRTACSPAIWRT